MNHKKFWQGLPCTVLQLFSFCLQLKKVSQAKLATKYRGGPLSTFARVWNKRVISKGAQGAPVKWARAHIPEEFLTRKLVKSGRRSIAKKRRSILSEVFRVDI